MKLKQTFHFVGVGDKTCKFIVDDICPYCNSAIEPIFNGGFSIPINDWQSKLITAFSCRVCENTFIHIHLAMFPSHDYDADLQLLYTFPSSFSMKKFDSRISKISHMFSTIYNEALQAENGNHINICGMGYRKAAEFLIKDYLIFKGNAEEDIKEKPLGKCIEMINNEPLKQVAKRCVWLGNDHTHYFNKRPDMGLDVLKKLIDVTINLILLESDTEKVLKIEPV